MNIHKLAPWNWFKKEEELQGASLPVRRNEEDRDLSEQPIDSLWREMDRLFDDFQRGFGFAPADRGRHLPDLWGDSRRLKPSVDIASTDKEYTVHVELPGVAKDDVQVDVSGDTLRIRGEKKQEKEDKGRDYYAMERSYGSFQRTLALPEDADCDHISATFKNGVMSITIPREETAQSVKQLEVQTN